MDYDKRNADLFLLNFNEAYRSAKLLMISYERVRTIIPMQGDRIVSLPMDDLDKLDAFRVRFCDLQDSLGNKVFRSLLVVEEELPGSNLDTLHKMEKRKILSSFEDWKQLRYIRNLFAHDYPESEEEKSEALNIAYLHTLKLVQIVDTVILYAKDTLHFPMNDFSLILKDEV
jgi:hypothetical protein